MVDEDSLDSPEGDNPPKYHDPQLLEAPDDNIGAETPCISFHALMGQVVPSILKIA